MVFRVIANKVVMYQSFTLPLIAYILGHRLSATRWMTCTNSAALFIGLRYMRGRAADRFGRFVSWLSTIGITLGVMALVTVLSVMNGFERELQKQHPGADATGHS